MAFAEDAAAPGGVYRCESNALHTMRENCTRQPARSIWAADSAYRETGLIQGRKGFRAAIYLEKVGDPS